MFYKSETHSALTHSSLFAPDTVGAGQRRFQVSARHRKGGISFGRVAGITASQRVLLAVSDGLDMWLNATGL